MSATSVWAEVEAPTMPASVAPESGGTYYLYNVESEMFLTNVENSTSYVGVGKKGRPVLVTKETNGAYTLKFADTNYTIYSYSEYVQTISSATYHNYDYWSISESENSYLIQRAPQNTNYYKADQYVGRAGETSYYVYANRTANDAIHWLFFAADDHARHYMAEKMLYDQLCTIQGLIDAGYCTTPFTSLYENRATASTEALTEAANQLSNALGMTTGYQTPEWNERPILFSTADGEYGKSSSYTWALPNNSNTSGSYYERYLHSNSTSSLRAVVSVTEKSVFVYELSASVGQFNVYVDGQLSRSFDCGKSQVNNSFREAGSHDRFFEDLEPGVHTITWEAKNTSTSNYYYYVYNVGCMAVPQITVDLLEPGSMGTEVLYQTDHIKNVRRLKVRGKMNDEDWKKIQMMSYLYELDLSEAETTHVPESQFDGYNADYAARFLRTVILPEGLETIETAAFRYTYVENVTFPQSCTKISGSAFYGSHITEAILSDNLEEIGDNSRPNDSQTHGDNKYFNYAFYNCRHLKKVSLGSKLKSINYATFCGCTVMQEINMPNCITNIYDYAFSGCRSLQTVTFGDDGITYENQPVMFPEGLKTIGTYAFSGCKSLYSINVPSSVTSVGERAFNGCAGLVSAELGANVYSLYNSRSIFAGCSSLRTLRLNSPTVVKINDDTYEPNRPIENSYRANITLQVPAFAVNNYKLDQYWYNFKAVEGFETEEVPYWPINDNLVLNRERFGGCPDLKITALGSLKINGDDAQNFQDVIINQNQSSYDGGCLLSNCDNLSINGDLKLSYYMGTANKNKNSWHFTSLPFDMKVGDIDTKGAQLAIRAYDGANRAANGATGSWKKLTADDVIPAGTGFIFQTDQAVWIDFKAVENETKQYIVSPNEFVKALAANESATASNAGWNLVGNPYQCYYNDHMLNFTGPITVWNGSSYTAYSITDDDYAIRPNEAFFVQCPENVSSIGFPTQGRQLTSVIESQNAAPSLRTEAAGISRCLIDLTVSLDSLTDRTRVVLNEQATLGYELTRDASKFMSMDTSVPQLYTVDADGTQYAINERPVADGTALVGFYAPTKGTYTFSLSRCDADHVWLTDRETGLTVNLAEGDYVFSAEAGTTAQRFTLGLEGATKIEQTLTDDEETVIYDLSGRTVQQPVEGIYLQNGQKVVIR